MANAVEALWRRQVYSPVPVRNAFEVTVERLAQAIRLGILVEGHRLPPERELAETFGVSRVTLREAIRALRVAGMLRTRPGRGGGTYVASPAPAPGRSKGRAKPTADELADTLDLRRIVEPGAAWLAAQRPLSAESRAMLEQCLVDTEVAGTARRVADSRLHLAIAAAGGSATLTEVVAEVQLRIDDYLRAIPVLATNISHSDAQHTAIVHAILAGRPDDARGQMEEHVDGTAALLRGFLG